jgi:NADPH2:quinone reductase
VTGVQTCALPIWLYLADQPLPAVTGLDGSGVVSATSVDTRRWQGKRVAFLASGAAADQCLVDAGRLIELPEALSFIEGAAFPVQALTAWHVLHTMGRVEEGDTVCVTASAGGVGLLAVQLANRAGAHVIGLVSSPEKATRVLARGAHEVIVGADTQHLVDSVDVLLDSVGREAAAFALRALRPFGRWVCFGDASGPSPAIAPATLLEKSLQVSGWWLRTPHPVATWQRAIDDVLDALASHELELDVTTVELERISEAHEALEARRSVGKFVVSVR